MSQPGTGVTHVTADDLDTLLRDGWRVLDVRETWEVAVGGVPDAVTIPLGQLPGRTDELAGHDWLVVCRVGARSAQACMLLERRGLRAVNLMGGMHAWQDGGRPVVTAEGTPGQVA